MLVEFTDTRKDVVRICRNGPWAWKLYLALPSPLDDCWFNLSWAVMRSISQIRRKALRFLMHQERFSPGLSDWAFDRYWRAQHARFRR